jgi:hypothetical protein
MPSPGTLSRLRKVRDLMKDRDDLIRKAIEEDHSYRKVAEAIGLSPGRVKQIIDGK